MDIEEIKCPLCDSIYNETDHLPRMLPDCGHSFCHSCLDEQFKGRLEEGTEAPFLCPEDE
jgi:hypothetical protein